MLEAPITLCIMASICMVLKNIIDDEHGVIFFEGSGYICAIFSWFAFLIYGDFINV